MERPETEKSGSSSEEGGQLNRNRSFKSKQLVRSQAIREAPSPPRAASPPPLPCVSVDRDPDETETVNVEAIEDSTSDKPSQARSDGGAGEGKGKPAEAQATGGAECCHRQTTRRWLGHELLSDNPRVSCVCGPQCRGSRRQALCHTKQDSGISCSDDCPDCSDNEHSGGSNSNSVRKSESLDLDTTEQPTFCRCAERKEKPKNVSLSRHDSDDRQELSEAELVAFIKATLNKNARDRMTLLKIEKELHSLVNDTGRCIVRFPVMTSYGRMLVHRVASLFELAHHLDSMSKNTVLVSKNGTSGGRIPCTNFKQWCTVTFPSSPHHMPSHDATQAKSILKRDALSLDEGGGGGGASQAQRSKSLEQREREYERVRRRIFSNDNCGADEAQWPWLSGGGPVKVLAPDSGRNKLLKVQSLEGAQGASWRNKGSVAKSHSFGGYEPAPRVLSRQGDLASSSWRLSPSSSGYKTLSMRSTDSVTPSPTGGVSPEPAGAALVWAVTDLASVPPGALIIHPQTGRPLTNPDGSVYRYDPGNPPLVYAEPSGQEKFEMERTNEKRRGRLEKQHSFIDTECECPPSEECRSKACCECRRQDVCQPRAAETVIRDEFVLVPSVAECECPPSEECRSKACCECRRQDVCQPRAAETVIRDEFVLVPSVAECECPPSEECRSKACCECRRQDVCQPRAAETVIRDEFVLVPSVAECECPPSEECRSKACCECRRQDVCQPRAAETVIRDEFVLVPSVAECECPPSEECRSKACCECRRQDVCQPRAAETVIRDEFVLVPSVAECECPPSEECRSKACCECRRQDVCQPRAAETVTQPPDPESVPAPQTPTKPPHLPQKSDPTNRSVESAPAPPPYDASANQRPAYDPSANQRPVYDGTASQRSAFDEAASQKVSYEPTNQRPDYEPPPNQHAYDAANQRPQSYESTNHRAPSYEPANRRPAEMKQTQELENYVQQSFGQYRNDHEIISPRQMVQQSYVQYPNMLVKPVGDYPVTVHDPNTRPMSLTGVMYPTQLPPGYAYTNQCRMEASLPPPVYQPVAPPGGDEPKLHPQSPHAQEPAFRIDSSYPYQPVDACSAGAGYAPHVGYGVGYGQLETARVLPSCQMMPPQRYAVPYQPMPWQNIQPLLATNIPSNCATPIQKPTTPPNLYLPPPDLPLTYTYPFYPYNYPVLPQMVPYQLCQPMYPVVERKGTPQTPEGTPDCSTKFVKQTSYHDNRCQDNERRKFARSNSVRSDGSASSNPNSSEIAAKIQQIKDQMAALNTQGEGESREVKRGDFKGRRNNGSGILGSYPSSGNGYNNNRVTGRLQPANDDSQLSTAARAIVNSIRSMQAKNNVQEYRRGQEWRDHHPDQHGHHQPRPRHQRPHEAMDGADATEKGVASERSERAPRRPPHPAVPHPPYRQPFMLRQMSPGTWCRGSPDAFPPSSSGPRRPPPDSRHQRRP